MRRLSLLLALIAVSGLSGEIRAEPWSTRAALNEARQEVAVAELAGKVYVIGGIRGDGTTADSVEVYDPDTDEWTFAAPLPTGLHHTAAAAVGGKLYAVGGFIDLLFTPTDAVFEYDVDRNAWAERVALPTRRGALAVAALDGKIYAVGGSPTARESDFAVYDPEANAWTTLRDVPTPRNHLAAVAFGGRVYAVGGRTGFGIDRILAALEEFDPATGEWASKPPMPTARGGIAGVAIRGRIVVFGGEGNPDAPQGVFSETEAYDPTLNDWAALTPMPTPRHGIGAAVVGDLVYLPGGAPVQGFGVTDVHEVFSPAGEADFDGDDVEADNCIFIANPDQTDTDADGCGNRCDADFDHNGTVGLSDFGLLSASFGMSVPPAAPDLDTDGNGAIGLSDFGLLSAQFGGPPGPSALSPDCIGAGP